VAELNRGLALAQAPERQKVGIVEALSDLGNAIEGGQRGARVSGKHLLKSDGYEQEALLYAVVVVVAHQPAGSGDPRESGSHLTSIDEVHPNPESAPCGAFFIAALE
jgi:hypothetical protein